MFTYVQLIPLSDTHETLRNAAHNWYVTSHVSLRLNPTSVKLILKTGVSRTFHGARMHVCRIVYILPRARDGLQGWTRQPLLVLLFDLGEGSGIKRKHLPGSCSERSGSKSGRTEPPPTS